MKELKLTEPVLLLDEQGPPFARAQAGDVLTLVLEVTGRKAAPGGAIAEVRYVFGGEAVEVFTTAEEAATGTPKGISWKDAPVVNATPPPPAAEEAPVEDPGLPIPATDETGD